MATSSEIQQFSDSLDALLNSPKAIAAISYTIAFLYLKIATAAPWFAAFIFAFPYTLAVGIPLMLLLWLGIGLCALAQRNQP